MRQAIVGQTRRKLNKLRDFLRVFFIFDAILEGWGGGRGGVYQTRGVYQRGASNTNYTAQGGVYYIRGVYLRVGIYQIIYGKLILVSYPVFFLYLFWQTRWDNKDSLILVIDCSKEMFQQVRGEIPFQLCIKVCSPIIFLCLCICQFNQCTSHPQDTPRLFLKSANSVGWGLRVRVKKNTARHPRNKNILLKI